ncbi:hypothetical protein BH11PAT2_BH11PAT2_01540 [soil metagenome]
MEFLAHGQPVHLRMAWWIDDEPDEERQEQERTAIKKALFLETLERSSYRISAAAQHIDIARSTYYHWRNSDPKFKKDVDQMLKQRGMIMRDLIMTKALDGDLRAMMYLDKKFNKDTNPNKKDVHIHYHMDKKDELVPQRTLEDLIDDQALKTRKLVEEGKMPHLVQRQEEDLKKKGMELEKPNTPWEGDKE